jgi:polyisoprenoid-binding protein YceI
VEDSSGVDRAENSELHVPLAQTEANEGLPADPGARRGGLLGLLQRHKLLSGAALLSVLGLGVLGWTQVRPLLSPEYRNVSYQAPVAPQLTASSDETLYRIDPSQSEASYVVDETFAGSKPRRTRGTTNGIAGDFALNASNPEGSRVGEIVIDLEQLHSDDALRDARLRSAYLESYSFPLATFTEAKLIGLPNKIEVAQQYEFEMQGSLSIKKTTLPATWQVVASQQGGKLNATATTTIKMSDYQIGPISLAGMLRTGDEVTLTLQLVALNPDKEAISTEITAPPTAAKVKNAPSFKAEVMPVLAESCASCHNTNAMGSHHWKLDTAEDASRYSHALGVVTTARYMPPWPASDKGVPLKHSKALDKETIAMLAEWADAGGPLDVAKETPIRPSAKARVTTIRKDKTLRMAEPYTGSLANPNDYRCFEVDPGFTEATFMTGFEFIPDQIKEIHHAQVFQISAEARPAIAGLEGKNLAKVADGQPGWSCYTGTGVGAVVSATGERSSGSRLIAGWAPGREASKSNGAGILFQPGDTIVLQMHYHYSDTIRADQSAMVMQTERGTSPIREITVMNPLGPVEIPCEAGATEPLCDRAAALEDNVKLYGPSGAFIEPSLLRACKKTAEELAIGVNGTYSSSCDSVVPFDGQIIEVLGHMHTLGRTFRMTLRPDTPQEQVLLDIPNWNFGWQMLYELKTPADVAKGDKIRIECSWNRDADPLRAKKYIVFAEGTEDEMCFNTYSLVPPMLAPAPAENAAKP